MALAPPALWAETLKRLPVEDWAAHARSRRSQRSCSALSRPVGHSFRGVAGVKARPRAYGMSSVTTTSLEIEVLALARACWIVTTRV